MTAYGKDRSVIDDMASWRQTSAGTNANRGVRAPRGGPPYWIGKYTPPLEDTDLIQIIPGRYEHARVDESGEKPVALPFFKQHLEYIEHYDAKMRKSSICSAGPLRRFRDHRNACHGCDIFWATYEPDETGKKDSTRMTRGNKRAVGIIDFSVYHKHPQIDPKTGRPKPNPRTPKEPYFNWVKCEGTGCDACRAGLESKFGHNPHWPMSFTNFEQLLTFSSVVESSCCDCGGIDTIKSVAWVCRACGELAIDMETTRLKKKDIKDMTDAFYICQTLMGEHGETVRTGCGATMQLKELVACTACSGGQRLKIFDAAFKVSRVLTGNNNQFDLSLSSWRKVGDLASFIRPLVPKGVRPPSAGDIAALQKPLDLARLFAPTPQRVQVARFGPAPLEVPNEPDPEAPAESREYGEQYQ